MGCVSIEYDARVVNLSSPKKPERSSAVFLVDTDNSGQMTLAFSDIRPRLGSTGNTVVSVEIDWKSNAENTNIGNCLVPS
jgi:hypothetical protein